MFCIPKEALLNKLSKTMNKQTRMALVVLGIAAIAVPIVLLLTLGSKAQEIPPVSSDSRNIDQKNIQDVTKKTSSPEMASPAVSPSHSPSPRPTNVPAATSSAIGGQ